MKAALMAEACWLTIRKDLQDRGLFITQGKHMRAIIEADDEQIGTIEQTLMEYKNGIS